MRADVKSCCEYLCTCMHARISAYKRRVRSHRIYTGVGMHARAHVPARIYPSASVRLRTCFSAHASTHMHMRMLVGDGRRCMRDGHAAVMRTCTRIPGIAAAHPRVHVHAHAHAYMSLHVPMQRHTGTGASRCERAHCEHEYAYRCALLSPVAQLSARVSKHSRWCAYGICAPLRIAHALALMRYCDACTRGCKRGRKRKHRRKRTRACIWTGIE